MAGAGGREAGRLSVRILPDTRAFGADLQKFLDRTEARSRLNIPVTPDTTGFDERIKQEQRRPRDPISIPAEPKTDDFRRKLLTDAKKAVAGVQMDIPATVEGEQLRGELDLLVTKLERTSKIDMPLEIGDRATWRAELSAQLEEIKARAAAANPQVKIDVDQSASSRLTELTSVGGQFSLLTGRIGAQLAAWGPLIAAALAGMIAIAPAALVALPAVLGIAGAIGAIVLAKDQLGNVFGPLVKQLGSLKSVIGPQLVAGIAPMVQQVAGTIMPALSAGLSAFAGVVNTALKSLLGFFGSASGGQLLQRALTGAAAAMKPLAGLAGPLVRLFLQLSTAAAPALQKMLTPLAGVVDKMNAWAASGKAASSISGAFSTIGSIFSSLGKVLGPLVKNIVNLGPAFGAVFSGIADALSPVLKALTPVTALIGKLGPILRPVAAAVTAVVLATTAWSAAQALLNLALTANPIGLIVIAIAALVAGLIYAWKNSETFRNIVTGVFNAIKTVVTTVVGAVVGFVQSHWRLLITIIGGPLGLAVALVTKYWSQIRSAVAAAVNAVKAVVGAVFSAVSSVIRANVAVWRAVITAVWNAIKAVVRAGVSTVKSYINGIGVIATVIRTAFQRGVDAVRNAVASMLGLVRGIGGKVKDAFSGAGRWLYDAGKAIIQGLLDGINSLIKQVEAKLKALTKKIPKHKGPPSTDKVLLRDNGRLIMQSLVDGFDDGERNVQAWLKSLTGNLGVNVPGGIGAVAGASSAQPGPLVEQNIYPQPGQSETEIGAIASARLTWGLRLA